VRASHDLSKVSMSFTEANLIPNAGVLPAAVLAQRIGLGELVDERLGLSQHGANSGAKALTVIGSMLAGGDSIDDTALLRAGARWRVGARADEQFIELTCSHGSILRGPAAEPLRHREVQARHPFAEPGAVRWARWRREHRSGQRRKDRTSLEKSSMCWKRKACPASEYRTSLA
jgi:hypothetical protein